MPFSRVSRWLLTAAMVHLSVAGALLLFEGTTEVLAQRWDAFVWLLLMGFLGCSTLGFSFHLFPVIARRRLASVALEGVTFALAELGVVLGGASLAGLVPPSLARGSFSLAAACSLGAFLAATALFVRAAGSSGPVASPSERRPGDAVSVPLFLAAWVSASGASMLFVLAGLSFGPGFGWWIAGVHLFVLGHVVPLVTAVSLRLVPRSVDADPPRWVVLLLAALALAGAALVPASMLAVVPWAAEDVGLAAVPEGIYALLFLSLLVYLAAAAKTPRRQLGLQATAVTFLLAGGTVGLWMVDRSSYDIVVAHALVNVLGFVGLTIMVAWFGMIAPFQRISHAWTRRMLWALAVTWVTSVATIAVAEAATHGIPSWVPALAGGLAFVVALGWAVGTIPVLYPRLNPLPGMSVNRLREIRERWARR